MTRITLTQPGEFILGANYWASHAGTAMWRDWRPEVVDGDLAALHQAGLQVLRVFPLWPDFQPLSLLYGGGGRPREMRHGEEPLPDGDCGQAGLSEEMMDRFAQFLDLAAKHDLECIVGLLTGWMSGRLHVPPALGRVNVLTDPAAIRWEVRFVRHFVRRFKDHPALAGWDLGNECNCMGEATRDQAYLWTSAVADAIRVADPAHPVVSGMHGLTPTGHWAIEDQAELTDVLTTHPYPAFTPHCDQDPVDTIRTLLHSTAESRYYADVGGKPCLCQEIGTLGPMMAGPEAAARFTRGCLFSLWAHDCHGFVWWCAFDQTHLTHAPYDWHPMERELGLMCAAGTCKPALQTMTAFRAMLDALPFDPLPARTREAVCVLTEGQDQWGVAYSSFVLAKQAGFDLEFQYATQPLRSAPLYLLPCLSGHSIISGRRMRELLAAVKAGATLYISLDTGLPAEFRALTGLEVQSRERRRGSGTIRLDALDGRPEIPAGGSHRVRLEPRGATVLGSESDGNPAFSVFPYGEGKVYFLGVPMEMMLTRTPGAFHTPEAPPCWQVYRHVAAEALAGRAVAKSHPLLGLTEHPLADDRRLIVAVNYSPQEIEEQFQFASGWRLDAVHHGRLDAAGRCHLPGADGAVFAVALG
jgi:hypothetical protein